MTVAVNDNTFDHPTRPRRAMRLDAHATRPSRLSGTSTMREWATRLGQLAEAPPDEYQDAMNPTSVRAAWKILNSLGRLGVDTDALHVYATNSGNVTFEADHDQVFRSVELISDHEFVLREQDLNLSRSGEWATDDWQAAISALTR